MGARREVFWNNLKMKSVQNQARMQQTSVTIKLSTRTFCLYPLRRLQRKKGFTLFLDTPLLASRHQTTDVLLSPSSPLPIHFACCLRRIPDPVPQALLAPRLRGELLPPFTPSDLIELFD